MHGEGFVAEQGKDYSPPKAIRMWLEAEEKRMAVVNVTTVVVKEPENE